MAKNISKILSIAGSDCSGGAGIQADIKTILANGGYAMTAITALTAQNTMGVYDIMNVSPEFLKKEIDACFEDIYPDAVKVGMVSTISLIEVIAKELEKWQAKNVVIDPVMVATSGSRLIDKAAEEVLKEKLIPLATLITPNIPEAELISGIKVEDKESMEMAANIIFDGYKVNVLLKGGHSINDADDLLFTKDGFLWIKGERITTDNTHGTGCTLSSAIATYLAKGYNIFESVTKAKKYISDALKSDINLGKGSGPLDHGYSIKEI